MATELTFLVNYVNAEHNYEDYPADFIEFEEDLDYLIWSELLEDLMTHEPTQDELNATAPVIDETDPVTIAKSLIMDDSHPGGYYTRLIKGMGEDKKFVYCFSFNGATATEPQLEAWDDDDHDSYDNHVLGNGTPNNSFVKGKCTTTSPPGAEWAGNPLAGGENVILLNDGNGALDELETGETSHDLYANLKIVIPANYPTPKVENFVLTVRFTWF